MSLTDEPRDAMPALLRLTAVRSGPTGAECLDDVTIAAVVDGSLDPSARAVVNEHLASCARCRAAVAGVSGLVANPVVARETAKLDRPRWIRPWQVPLGVAAAAALALLFAWPRTVDDGAPTHRAPTITAAPEPSPMAPVGVVAAAARLRWAPVPGADRYRVTLFATDGRALFETQLDDTVATLPDSVVLIPGRTYLWRVEARTSWDRWTASPLIEFSVASPAPP